MKFDTLSRRVAAAGAVTALAGGALVATATSASADPTVSNNYSCTAVTGVDGNGNPTTATFPLSVTSNAVGIEGFPQFAAGATIPAAIPVTNHFVMPSIVKGLFQSKSVDSVSFPDIGAVFSGTDVVVGESGPLKDDGTVDPAPSAKVADMTAVSGTPALTEFEADGQNKTLTAPAAGVYDLVMPSTFHVNANNAEGTPLTQATCTLTDDAAGALHHITLTKNTTSGTAKSAKKSYKKGSLAKVNASFTAPNVVPSGKVSLVNKAGKKLATATLNDLGKAALTTKKLPVGKNKLSVVYPGNGYTKPFSAPVTVVVKR